MHKQGDSESTENTKSNEVWTAYVFVKKHKIKETKQIRIFDSITTGKIFHLKFERLRCVWIGHNIKTINLE